MCRVTLAYVYTQSQVSELCYCCHTQTYYLCLTRVRSGFWNRMIHLSLSSLCSSPTSNILAFLSSSDTIYFSVWIAHRGSAWTVYRLPAAWTGTTVATHQVQARVDLQTGVQTRYCRCKHKSLYSGALTYMKSLTGVMNSDHVWPMASLRHAEGAPFGYRSDFWIPNDGLLSLPV